MSGDLMKCGNILAKQSGRKFLIVCVCGFLLSFGAGILESTPFNFSVITANGIYYDDPALDLQVDVFDSGGLVGFEFNNYSTMDSVVKSIYFETGPLLELDHIVNYIISEEAREETKFLEGSLGNLPAGNTLPVAFETAFYVESDPAAPKWGINPDEKLQVYFSLQAGKDFGDVIAGLTSQEFRIGLHVIALPDGSSEATITVPEPTITSLLIFGSLGSFLVKRRKQKRL